MRAGQTLKTLFPKFDTPDSFKIGDRGWLYEWEENSDGDIAGGIAFIISCVFIRTPGYQPRKSARS